MRYFLDTEFNEMGGDLISLALVRDDGHELYVATDCFQPKPWVKANVIPIVDCPGARPVRIFRQDFGYAIEAFLSGDGEPVIVADWPDDVRYCCEALIVAPGEMVAIPRLTFDVVRVDAYPTDLPGAVQHNALWDARALRYVLTNATPRVSSEMSESGQ